MPFTDDDGTEGWSFIWTIENFSYCLHKPGEYLSSPDFVLDGYETDMWQLKLYPRGVFTYNISDSKCVSLYLLKNSNTFRRVEFTLSVQTTKGSTKKHPKSTSDISGSGMHGLSQFLTSEELREKGGDTYLVNDTMTLRCRILKVGGTILPNRQCYARTIISVERTKNIWSLEKFLETISLGEITTKIPISYKWPSLNGMNLVFREEKSFSGTKIKLLIKHSDKNKPCFVTCDLSLMKPCGEVVDSLREEYRFAASEASEMWTISGIPLINICDRDNMYLRCELAVSPGIEHSWVERVEIGKSEILQPSCSDLKKELDFNDSLKNDLQRYYNDGMLTDFIIRTPSKEFPVHKPILCARSTVFRAMFERDMKENRTGVVDIEDIDADTVHKMLLFAYSDVVEDLDCDAASKLYFAADKYRITALRRRCSDFLKENLSVSNVCEVTVLANMHQDEDLKSFTEDFIMEHAAEVIPSLEWKQFKQNHVHLHSETMDVLFLRNLNISK